MEYPPAYQTLDDGGGGGGGGGRGHADRIADHSFQGVGRDKIKDKLIMQPMSLWDYATLSWLTPMMLKGAHTPIEFEDLPGLRDIGLAEYIKRFVEPYQEQISRDVLNGNIKRRLPSPLGHLWRAFGLRWLVWFVNRDIE